jgi:type II secretory pathway pseudopilin PulG
LTRPSVAEAGFSLVEALIATTVLIVALGGIAPLFVAAARVNRSARQASIAVLLARSKMEQLRAFPSAGRGSETIHEAGSAYVRRWRVEPLGSMPGRALFLQVDVLAVQSDLPTRASFATIKAAAAE